MIKLKLLIPILLVVAAAAGGTTVYVVQEDTPDKREWERTEPADPFGDESDETSE
jgi:hypothetical protein